MAAELGVPAAELRRSAAAGDLPCVRIGARGVLFDRERLLAALLRRAQESAEAQGNALPQSGHSGGGAL